MGHFRVGPIFCYSDFIPLTWPPFDCYSRISTSINLKRTKFLQLEMIGLGNLPPEVLQKILSGSSSHLIIGLWKCGDKTLQSRIKQIHRVSMHLIDNNSASTSRFPQLLSSLHHLHELSIKRSASLGTPLLISQSLRALSSSLQKLEIDSSNAFDYFLASPGFNVMIMPDRPGGVPSVIWNIGATFPTLRHLSIEGKSPSVVLDSFKGLLPDSLTYLSLATASSPNSDLQSILPPNLETLHMTHIPSPLNYPQHLTSLHGFDSGSLDNANKLKLLPRGLRVLNASMRLAFSLEIGQALPPALATLDLAMIAQNTSFNIDSAHLDFVDWLPHHLTSLTLFHHPAGASKLTLSQITRLPRSLTLLSGFAIDFDSIASEYLVEAEHQEQSDFYSFWPPVLQSIAFPLEGISFTSNTNLRYIPPTITSISSIKVAGNHVNGASSDYFEWDRFPPSLTKLEIIDGHVAFVAPLPSTLTSLTVMDDVDLRNHPALPLSLTHLQIRTKMDFNPLAVMSPITIDMLPSGLRSLTIDSLPMRRSRSVPSSDSPLACAPSRPDETSSQHTETSSQHTETSSQSTDAFYLEHRRLGLDHDGDFAFLSSLPHLTTLIMNSILTSVNIFKYLPNTVSTLKASFAGPFTRAAMEALHLRCKRLTHLLIASAPTNVCTGYESRLLPFTPSIIALWPDALPSPSTESTPPSNPWETREKAISLRSQAYPDPRVLQTWRC